MRIPRSVRYGFTKIAGRVFNELHIDHIQVPINQTKLFIDPRNSWSLRVYALSPHYDSAEIVAVRKTIPGSYTFVDVGANFGVWSFSLADHFSRVLGVEPDSRCYQCCERTRKKFQISNVNFASVALADQDGRGLLFQSSSHIGDSRVQDPGDTCRLNGTPVELMSFDSLVKNHHLDTRQMFVKLDAQGLEPSIIRGMAGSISEAVDLIIFTEIQASMLNSMGSSVREYTKSLKQMGFVPVDLYDGLSEKRWDYVQDAIGVTKDFCFRLVK